MVSSGERFLDFDMVRMRFQACSLVALLLLTACEQLPPGPPRTLRTHPRAMDRFAVLLQRQVDDSTPRAAYQAMYCEFDRVSDALGLDETQKRVRLLEDSVFAISRNRAQRGRVDRALNGMVVETGTICDSLRAIADREAPIIPADTSIRNH